MHLKRSTSGSCSFMWVLFFAFVGFFNSTAHASGWSYQGKDKCHRYNNSQLAHEKWRPSFSQHRRAHFKKSKQKNKRHAYKPHHCGAEGQTSRQPDHVKKNMRKRWHAHRKPKFKHQTPTSTVTGQIKNVPGVAIENVTVLAVDISGFLTPVTAQTDSNGEFSLTLEAEKEYSLQLSNPSFGNQVIPILSPSTDQTAKLDQLVMLARGEIHSITADGEGEVASTDGASVIFDKANFVDSTGQPLNGEMQVTVTPVNVAQRQSLEAFPGQFLGASSNGATPELIVSLGATEFHFTHNGEPVNLASGATADVVIPIYVKQYPDGSSIEAGQTVSLRSLNESTGVWIQEGTGTIVSSSDSPTKLAFRATVSHFSWWGADVAIATPAGDTTPNTGVAYTVVTVDGSQSINAFAVIEATASGLVNWHGSTVAMTVNIGDTTLPLPIPANREVCFVAYIYYDSGAVGLTNEVCVNQVSESTLNINVSVGDLGPIDVGVQPQTADDTAFIQGFVGVQSPPLTIAPITVESIINYSIASGTLPNGLNLEISNNVVNLVGTPTTAGESTFVIRAIDLLLNIDDVTVTYNVSGATPPPNIEREPDLFFTGTITTPGGTVELNIQDLVTNVGGPINLWLEVDDFLGQAECSNLYSTSGGIVQSADPLLPEGATLNVFSGTITFDRANTWAGCLSAVNAEGVSIFPFLFEITESIFQPPS